MHDTSIHLTAWHLSVSLLAMAHVDVLNICITLSWQVKHSEAGSIQTSTKRSQCCYHFFRKPPLPDSLVPGRESPLVPGRESPLVPGRESPLVPGREEEFLLSPGCINFIKKLHSRNSHIEMHRDKRRIR